MKADIWLLATPEENSLEEEEDEKNKLHRCRGKRANKAEGETRRSDAENTEQQGDWVGSSWSGSSCWHLIRLGSVVSNCRWHARTGNIFSRCVSACMYVSWHEHNCSRVCVWPWVVFVWEPWRAKITQVILLHCDWKSSTCHNLMFFLDKSMPHCHVWALLFSSFLQNWRSPEHKAAAHEARTPYYIYIEAEADSAPSGACWDKPEVWWF